SASHQQAPAISPAPSPDLMLRMPILSFTATSRPSGAATSVIGRSGQSAAPAPPAAARRPPCPPGTTSRYPPRPETQSRVGMESRVGTSVSRAEAPDHVEGRAAPALVDGDRHADAEEAPEEDLDGRVVEGVEVAHRDQEADARGEDRPQHEPEPPVGDRARAATDRRQRRADHPHHERPADEPRALHEGE